MKRTLLTIAAVLAVATTVSAQRVAPLTAMDANYRPEGWVGLGAFGVKTTQSSFSNWSAGGDNSIAFDANFNYSLNYMRDRNLWDNRLELAYGMNDTKSNGTRKTNDKIYFSSNYGYEIGRNLYVGAMVTFLTQFDKGYDYSNLDQGYLSTFMSPGYLNAGAGLIWTAKPWFKLTFLPATWRGTFVLDDRLSDEGAFGVDPGKTLFNQFGADLIGELNVGIMENVSLYSRLELYSNYLEKPQNVIVNWDTMLNMQINRWLSAGLTFSMIYDDNVKFLRDNGRRVARLQIKEVLGVGLQIML